MAERVYVNEVGLRDGLQIHPHFIATDDKLALLDALIAAGVTSFEATSFVSPKAVPQMADSADLFKRLPVRPGVEYHALIPNEKGYERAIAAGARSVALVLAATETLNKRNINMSLGEAVEVCKAVLRRARAEGVATRAYIAAACACPYEGKVAPAAVFALTDEMFAAGAADIGIADTIGAGNPAQVAYLFGTVAKKHGAARVSAHFHDTRAMGLTNAWAALQEGIRRFDSSIGGLGGCPFAPGASGNLATEDLVFMLQESGFETGIDIAGLRQAVTVAERITSQHLGGRVAAYFASQDKRRAAAAE
ncbi:MAG: hydroxymethylglutaryl-CoA lyase [Alphaproteobacteria bacterium]|nr:hydroxymethylglutaryl-CoA lyase [Alphaproteobacteria bacterium]